MHKLLFCTLALLVTGTAQAASTLRCNSGLVSLDDTAGEIFNTCGEPVSRDMLGYREVIDQYGFRNEVQVEEWIYGPRGGMYYYLRLEGNRLVKIESKRGQ
ncbi:DUF2845 domain-containing protein [Pseudomonas sp. PDM14]|uniref:DUF2845 domain-containing protein n=1 Tax=Pseudomonas sp. PDM14 TaxID=2769288 RepID=UPI00177DEF8C|nr:DUF2845 domain-containing protein [Pseudomonas sp. PDM14]MBD9482447.1 DUF2845 domain-containing protein [Pseudomonas sp. PDM14]